MKLSDLFIRGRQLFGFLFPGAMWIASLAMLLRQDLLGFLEAENRALRIGGFLALSYIAGFCLQTLLFRLIADSIKRGVGVPESVRPLFEQIKKVIGERQPAPTDAPLIPDEHVPTFCKWYVLENSSELRNLLSELEVDINFLVANTVPLPVLVFSSLYYADATLNALLLGTAAAAALSVLLILRLKAYLRREVEKWLEMFWVLQVRPGGSTGAGS